MSETPFSLALLGFSSEIVPLLQAIADSPRYQLNMACDVGRHVDDVRRMHPLVAWPSTWEELLSGTVDAVLVADGQDEADRADVLRKLVQQGVPLLVLHPACDMLLGLELLMIQRDTGGVILPYLPELANPALDALGAWNVQGKTPLGTIQQCSIEAIVADAKRDQVLRTLGRDALLMRAWMEPVRRVSALGPSDPQAPLATLSVQMATESGAIVRWQNRTDSNTAPRRQWTLTGSDGTLGMVWSDAGVEWVISHQHESEPIRGSARHAPAAMLHRLERAVRERPMQQGTILQPTWEQACRALEVQDTVLASCRRNKTIDLHLEEVSEEQTFKAMMAAGGCLILILVLLLLPMIGAIEAVVFPGVEKQVWENPPWSWFAPRRWPIYLAGGLLAFLGLQLLRFLFRSNAAKETSA